VFGEPFCLARTVAHELALFPYMNLDNQQLIDDVLMTPRNAMLYSMSKRLTEAFPDKTIWPIEDYDFNVRSFAKDGHCTLQLKSGPYSDKLYGWDETNDVVYTKTENSWSVAEWNGQQFELVKICYDNGGCLNNRRFLIADTEESAEDFFSAVCAWNCEIRGEILVYSGGRWYKDSDLFESILTTSLGNLVLQGSLKEEMQDDFQAFFRNEQTYRQFGIPWKRGVLLLGPPGNGKTHAIKGLVNLLGKPCLYVKSFKARHYTEHDCIREVFEKARASAPCLLVLEDLDSLLTDNNRSFFLNEMDGFASNEGIVTIASTNHPDRLDPAILDRPSRFDRKYTFELPDLECRVNFMSLRNETLEPALRLTADELAEVAAVTGEFSFAYLKELFLSSMMHWIGLSERGRLSNVMKGQVETLRAQMKTVVEPKSSIEEEDED